MKRRFFVLSVVLGFFAMTGCGPVDSSTEARPGKVYQGGMQSFSSQAEALAFARSRIAQCDTAITFRLHGANSSTASALSRALTSESSVSAVKAMAFGGIVVIEPQYAEETLLLRAYRDPSIEASLTKSQRGALKKARQAVAEARSKGSDYECARSLHDYLIKKTSYHSSSVASNLKSCTTAVLESGEGVCEGYTRAYRLLLNMAGIENKYVSGTAKGEPHCWNLVKLGGQWAHVDCTFDDPSPDLVDRAIHSYFGMSDSRLSATHTWNRGSVPSAPSDAAYYPFRSGMHFATMQECIEYCASHPMPVGFVTTYIEELGQPGADPEILLSKAQSRVGREVVSRYVVAKSNPRAFSVLCNY